MIMHNDEHEVITVLMDYKGTRQIRPFYCVRCRKCICEITGSATAFIPGIPDESERDELDSRIIVRCGGVINLGDGKNMRCTAKYIFN